MNIFDILSEGSCKTAEMIEKEMREAAAEFQQRPSAQILVISESFVAVPAYGRTKSV